MTHVHYKFSSKLSYDTVVFDGPHITLKDLKRQIMSREKLRAGDCDLQITNAQNKEEYTEDDCSIPKGSSVIVRRIPIIGAKSGSSSKIRNNERSDVQPHHAFGAFKAMDDQNPSRALPLFSKMANLADVDVSEEDKIKVMMNQCTYDMNYNKKFGTVLPANYTCYRCGNTGHHIRNCPTSGQDKSFEAPLRIKKSSGIPRSFMVEVDDPNIKGAMLTNCGRYAIPSIDIEAYAIGKKERPPFIEQDQTKSEDEEDPVPEELLCLICHNLLSDAVVIPCCGNSYCDDCIRTALLDSEEHVCPTCSQSDVSPDTLIANRFLRQAVDNFKKERGHTKSVRRTCATTQSQNPTPTPSPVPTPPPLMVQSQPQKPHLSAHSQQDPLLPCSQAADTPPSSQVCRAPPTSAGPTSAPNTPSTSLQPAQSHLEIPDKEGQEKTHDDSAAAAAPSVPGSPKDPTDAPSQLIPLVKLAPVVKQQHQQPSSGPEPAPPGPSTSWESSSSSKGGPTGGWTESNTQQLPPSVSSYPATPPPLFPSPHFHTFLTAQQPLGSFPPGFPPAPPVWPLPNLQGAPIPSLCPSTPIPALIPKEWYRHQRKKERSPHRGSSHRRSSSRSHSKSKSSRSYSRSSSRSRSRSRSRSQSRSRPHSPYSRHRNLHSRSHSSRPYSYGYKRSPTPSSSSSPQVGYHSRSKSPSDHRKNSHHSRHHSKKSSSYSSRKRGDHYQREAGGSGGSLASYLHAQQTNQSSSQELDRERYLQWERDYKMWCDKYFSSYVSHFHQLSLPLLNFPPPPQWGDREGSGSHSHADSDSRKRLQSRRTAQVGGRSPPSQSSSDSRSSLAQSSRDSRSTPSQSSSDSHSSPSHSSSDSRSPHLSSDGRSTPSEDGARLRAYQQRSTLAKGSEEVELQESSKDTKQPITKNSERPSTLKHEQKSMKKHEGGRGEESSSPDAADSTDDCRTDKRRHNTDPNTCKEGTLAQDEATAGEALESAKSQRLDKDRERKSREQRKLEKEKGWKRGKHSDSRQDAGRRHKEKPSNETDRYPRGSRAPDSRSEKSRKRKGEDIERRSFKAESSKCLKAESAEEPKTCKSESPNPFNRKKPNTEKKQERKTWPLTEGDIWEGGITVKPQKKISININLEGKRKEDLESVKGKTKEETEKAGNGEEEKFNRGEEDTGVNEKESIRDMEEKITPDEGEARQKWEKATFRDDNGEKKEEREKEDFDFYHSALGEVGEEMKETKYQREERDGMEASKGEEVTNEERRSTMGGMEAMGELVRRERAEGENRGNPLGESEPKEELMEGVKCRGRKEEERSSNESRHDRPNIMVDDGSSYEDLEEKKTMAKTLDENTQERAADGDDEVIQVSRSKWEKKEEEERDEGVVRIQTGALAAFLPLLSMSVTAETATNKEMENEERRERSVETERGRDREREKTPILSSSRRSVAPSSGKDSTDGALCSNRDVEKRMEMERRRESERPRDRQKESKRSKERTREGERDREREREKEHSSFASAKKRTPSSSSHSYSYSASHDPERRDSSNKSGRSRESSTISRDTELPDQNTYKSHRDALLDLKYKDHPHYHHFPQGPSGSCRQQDRPAGTHHSPPSLPHSRGKERDPLPSGSDQGKPSMSIPGLEFMQNRSRHESKVAKEEWKLQVIKEGKGAREYQGMVAERGGGGRWEEEADELDGQTKWEGRRQPGDEDRPRSRSNSVSSSASQENDMGDGRKERKKKQKKHKKEKRRASPELLEEEELSKRKMSKRSRDGREERRSGEVDDTKLCSVMLP